MLSLTGFVLSLIIVHRCEAADPFQRTVHENAMWVAALAGGCGMLLTAAIALMISTASSRRYEKKRLQQVLSMAPVIINITQADDEKRAPKESGGFSPLSLSVSSATMPAAAGHVYYNRAMDIDEGPEVERSSNLDGRSSLNRIDEITIC